ncbi:MAG: hypothetical protein LKF36_15370 [Lactobacillus sp.]|jgi:hypothetical protein|nr:hypothetical protein [Lactobacillus sp.]
MKLRVVKPAPKITLSREEELKAYQAGVEAAIYRLNKRWLPREEALDYAKAVAGSDVTFQKLVNLGLRKVQIPDSRKIAYDRQEIDELLEGLKI